MLARAILEQATVAKVLDQCVSAHAQSMPKSLSCYICLETDSDVILLGCSCRGSQPGAHLA
eukprot:4023684-Heterocapsa_arctica.AAC.1